MATTATPRTRKPAAVKPTEGPAWEPKGAAAKLAYIQAHIDYVPKTGRNEHQKFDYFQEHGIFTLLRPFMRQLKVCFIPTFTMAEKDGNMTSTHVRITMVDTEVAGDSTDRAVWAEYPVQATDNQGWGAAKALTYGVKFALQKFCMIPTDDLPEAERQAIEEATGQERPIGVSDPASVAELRAILTDGGADPVRVRGELTARYKVGSIEDLLPSQVQAFRDWATAEVARKAAA
jgi:hypothetical protein